MSDADYLIVGGGSAGATLASRLSEDPGTRVLLVEAGIDTPPDAIPADVADTFPSSSLNKSYFWPDLECTRSAGGAMRPFPQARIMGGGSSVMGLWALRGVPSDFDAWAAAGADGWGWSDVVRCYRRLEGDQDRDQTQMRAGPYLIRRTPVEEWPGFVVAIERAAAARGVRTIHDINENPVDGFFAIPLAQDDDGRASSARCYLTSAVRRRPNLIMMPQTRVIELRFDGSKVVGITAERGGEIKDLSAREVILSAGAIHSPAMLLCAGIGPAEELQRLGIAPRVDRRGVGRNLQNHPYLHFALTLPPRSRLKAHLRRFGIAAIRLSSGLEGCPPGDLLVFTMARVSPRPFGADVAMVGAALYSPYSRGAVTLVSPNIDVPPCVAFNMFDDPRDAPRILKAARFAQTLLCDPAVAASYNDAFLLPPVMALNQFNQPGLAGSLIAAAAKAVLNAPGPVTRWVVDRMIHPGRWFANRQRSVELDDAELLASAAPMAHPVSTCAIGRRDDPMAVVDSECRVYGVPNLRVVDASIMPRVPSANTNLPTIMVAERAAELIRAGRA
jgi:5-(hydroxymethyl)furfural/furfural oxidase